MVLLLASRKFGCHQFWQTRASLGLKLLQVGQMWKRLQDEHMQSSISLLELSEEARVI